MFTLRRVVQCLAIACLSFASHPAHALNTTAYTYRGGPILHPDIVPIFWDSTGYIVTKGQRDNIQSYLSDFVQYLNGSVSPRGLEPTVAQYGIRGATLEPYYNDTGTPPYASVQGTQCVAGTYTGPCIQSANQAPGFAAEVARLQGLNLIPPWGPERVFVFITNGITVPDMGTNIASVHRHPANGHYLAIVPIDYAGTNLNPLLSHEILESATDPYGDGWGSTLSGYPGGGELGDGCEGYPQTVTVGSDNIQVQGFWDLTTFTSWSAPGTGCTVWTSEQLPQMSAVAQGLTGGNIQSDVFALDGNSSLEHLSGTAWTGWGAWQSVGGVFATPPVTVAGADGQGSLDVFGVGTNKHLYHVQWLGSGSPTWEDLCDRAGAVYGRPAVVSWYVGGQPRTDVFVLGTDGAYYHMASTGSGFSHSWERIGGVFNGAPAVAWRTNAGLEVFGRGTDGNYYYKSYDGSAYTPSQGDAWNPSLSGHTFMSEPVISAVGGTLDVFGMDTSWKYYHFQQASSGNWSPTIDTLAGVYLGPPVASYQTFSQLDVVGRGTDGYYYHQRMSNGAWAQLEALNKNGLGGAALTVPMTGSLNVFVEGTDSNLSEMVISGTTLGSWGPSMGGSIH